MAKKGSKLYSIVVDYPLDWYFDNDSEADKFIRNTFRYFGIKDSGSGAGFGRRDISARISDFSKYVAVKRYLELFPDINVNRYVTEI